MENTILLRYALLPYGLGFLILNCFFYLGVSGKSQILFSLVYITRYLDLFTNFVSLYNTFMKVCFEHRPLYHISNSVFSPPP